MNELENFAVISFKLVRTHSRIFLQFVVNE